jgi:hypothetical protein
MSSEETRSGRPSSITGHQAPEAMDDELGTAGRDTERADIRKAMGDRKRNAEWPEVHDAFDTRTEEVDRRASGDPLGTPHNDRQTGPASRSPEV